MTVRVLWQLGDPYRDLTVDILTATTDGAAVLWLSYSGACTTFAVVDGLLTRTRSSRTAHLPGDGFRLLVPEPFVATPCGVTDGTGYAGTPAVVAAVVTTAADVHAVGAMSDTVLAAPGVSELLQAVPSGHPVGPCRALYCRRRVAEEDGG